CGKPYPSEVAESYRQRFLKYRDKLFTFLDYDGVPWHNNNAEHAIKYFAKYRMVTNGRVTANGLQPYLVLLSIYQTCVYKNVSFLRFLLSGEEDMAAFAENRRRRRATLQAANLTGQSESEQVPEAGMATAEPQLNEPAVGGSRKAELIDKGVGVDAPTDPALSRTAMAIIEEIVRKVVAGEDDPRLKWSRGGRRVR